MVMAKASTQSRFKTYSRQSVESLKRHIMALFSAWRPRKQLTTSFIFISSLYLSS